MKGPEAPPKNGITLQYPIVTLTIDTDNLKPGELIALSLVMELKEINSKLDYVLSKLLQPEKK